ncbi:unnamed protein product [Spodoptera littoralis]|uniref:Major facilitator superfamily (MFS) profile domain-containing protein n=1 Tax=Spodoptera littoralis TaxID=7109 RepID=A0A9P0HVY8_SPOLI|nr:unnamed protein product [Spodoptera littoralis]CAH1636386.1 unnamed protein product [Spodoptera littoralis]
MTAVKSEESDNKSDIFTKIERFGRYQTVQYILVCLTLFMISMTHVNYVFVAENVNYRCRVPECEHENQKMEIPTWWPEDIDHKCYKPILNTKKWALSNGTCSNSSFNGVIEECQHWIYENNNSIVAELNLACQPWKVNLVGGVHNAGMIVSMIFTGWIADKIGRKPTFIICAVGASVGVFKIFMTNYYCYLALEFLESVMGSGLYTVGVVLLIEVGGSSKRVLAGIIFSYAVYIGEIVFAFLAMSLHYWKWLIIVVYAPMSLFGLYFFCLRESTRWQMIRGRLEEAKETLKIMVRKNKIDLPEKEIEDASDDQMRLMFDIVEQKEKEGMKVIIGSKEIMTRLSVSSFSFFTSSFLYYGSLVHVVLLPGNKYTNFILSAFTAFPGEMLAYYTFNKYGRRITLQCGYLLSAVFLIAQNYCPSSLSWLKVILFLIGKLGVVICFTGIYTYSLELFPTSVRGTLLGWGNTAARVGSMLAPLTPLLITEIPALPSFLFSSSAVMAALLLTFTPETKNLPMFDTIAQVDSYKTAQFKEDNVETATGPNIISTKL